MEQEKDLFKVLIYRDLQTEIADFRTSIPELYGKLLREEYKIFIQSITKGKINHDKVPVTIPEELSTSNWNNERPPVTAEELKQLDDELNAQKENILKCFEILKRYEDLL